jgi:hypothetical protein
MYREKGARRMDQWTRAGLGVCVRPVRRHADTAGACSAAASRARRSGCFPFRTRWPRFSQDFPTEVDQGEEIKKIIFTFNFFNNNLHLYK